MRIRSMLLSQTLPIALVGAGLCGLAATTTAPVVAAKPRTEGSISVGGHAVSKVSYAGRIVSLTHYKTRVEPAAERAHRSLTLVVDRSAVARGYLVAFRTDRAAQAYLAAHGLGRLSTKPVNVRAGDRLRAAQRAAAAKQQTLNGRAVTLATCSLPSYYAYFWTNSACGGTYISMVNSDAIPHFSTYGYNDTTSSLSVGCKISNVDVWKDASYSGTHTIFGGNDVYTLMPSGWNDVISSAITDSSGAC
jgi:hypothetical protein